VTGGLDIYIVLEQFSKILEKILEVKMSNLVTIGEALQILQFKKSRGHITKQKHIRLEAKLLKWYEELRIIETAY
jgi:hypothetical protein